MAEMVDVRCEECGAVFPMMVGATDRKRNHTWHPGRRCPICGSEEFFPVVKTDKFEVKPLARWKVDRRVGIAAGVVIVVFLIVGVVWYARVRPHREAGLKAVYVCDHCGNLFIRGVTGEVPKTCPSCGERAGYRAVQCLKCSLAYAWKTGDSAGDSPHCPRCKSKDSAIVREPGLKAVYMCDVCKTVFVNGAGGKFPKKCPKCKLRASYSAAQCQNCNKVFPWKAKDWASDPPTCPECGSKEWRIRSVGALKKKEKEPQEQGKEAEKGYLHEEEKGVHPD